MARKVRGFERVLDAPALFAVAYDEIGSSIYFALGIVAAQALGLTPLVLLATGILFLIVSLSYAEGTAAIPETGGAATFTRRAYNDLVGFTTGWVLFLDYLIVIALSTLFLPHYLAASLSAPSLTKSPWDVMIAVLAIFLIVGVRLVRRTQIHTAALVLAGLDIAVQMLVVVLGLACVFSPDVLVNGFDFAAGQGWHDLFFALPLAMLAYTGLETVANLAEETREPGRVLPRSLFSVDRARRDHDRADRDRGAVGVPGRGRLHRPRRRLDAGADRRHRDRVRRAPAGDDGRHPARHRRAVGRADPRSPPPRRRSPGCTRLGRSMAEHGMLPREFGRLERRSLVSREALVATGAVAIAIVIVTGIFGKDDPAFLASAYSFGVLFAFTAAQLAVIRLRRKEPDLERPFRAKPEIMIRGVLVPLPALIGAPLTFAVWVLALITHPGARYAGPAWLLVGLVRLRRSSGAVARSACSPTSIPSRRFRRASTFKKLLVPMKLGDIGEEMVATAIALAKERGATIEAVFVVRVPRKYPARGRAARRRPGACRGIARGGAGAGRGERGRGASRTRSRPARSATRSSTRPAITAPT